MKNKKTLSAFRLEGSENRVIGFHNPRDLWNGWNQPYVTRDELTRYAKLMQWGLVFTEDSAIIQYTEFLGDSEYCEFPLEYVDTYRLGKVWLYNLSGLVWLELTRFHTSE